MSIEPIEVVEQRLVRKFHEEGKEASAYISPQADIRGYVNLVLMDRGNTVSRRFTIAEVRAMLRTALQAPDAQDDLAKVEAFLDQVQADLDRRARLTGNR